MFWPLCLATQGPRNAIVGPQPVPGPLTGRQDVPRIPSANVATGLLQKGRLKDDHRQSRSHDSLLSLILTTMVIIVVGITAIKSIRIYASIYVYMYVYLDMCIWIAWRKIT